ncbi:MAG: HU family DNA-binding protein [Nevskiales bacterium]|nr:HU family DNA-binding protein [Nevskiales bacterium]
MSETYSKAQLIEDIAAKTDLPKTQIKGVLDLAFENVVKKVKKGDRVALAGFGTFSLRKRAARKGRNPATGEQIKIKASKSIAFKVAKAAKDKL